MHHGDLTGRSAKTLQGDLRPDAERFAKGDFDRRGGTRIIRMLDDV